MGLFDKKKVARHKEIVAAMVDESLGETERVYHGQLQLLVRKFRFVAPAAEGVYAARLFGSAFVAWPFSMRWPKRVEDIQEVFNVASGLAFLPHGEPDAEYPLDIDSMREFGSKHFFCCLDAITAEIEQGPSRRRRPELSSSTMDSYAKAFGISKERQAELAEAAASAPMEDYLTQGFRSLEELWLRSLELSAGELRESERERFAQIISTTVFSHLELLRTVAASLR